MIDKFRFLLTPLLLSSFALSLLPAPAAAQISDSDFFVTANYMSVLGRRPDAGGWAYWTYLLNSSLVDRQTMTNDFIASQEYTNDYGGICDPYNPTSCAPNYIQGFVAQLYLDALDTTADPGGLASWTAEIQNGTYSEASAVNAFIYNQAFANVGYGAIEYGESAWVYVGDYALPGGTATLTGPAGSEQILTTTYFDPDGAGYVSYGQIVVNAAGVVGANGNNACYIAWDAGGDLVLSGLPEGHTGQPSPQMTNASCAVDAGNSTITQSGDYLTLNLALTFSDGFAGTHDVYAYALNTAGLNSGWYGLGSITTIPEIPDPNPGGYPNYLTLPSAPTPPCNITGTWSDTAAYPGTLVWQLTQLTSTVSGTAVSTGSGGSTTYQTVTGAVVGGAVTLLASNPSVVYDANGQEFAATITAPVAFSPSCYGVSQEQWYFPAFVYSFQNIPANTAYPNGVLTQTSPLMTFSVSPSPYIPMSTGDTNVIITTTASSPQFAMSNVTYNLSPDLTSPGYSACSVSLAIQAGSGTGAASSIVTASPSGCSGIFAARASVAGTLSQNFIDIVVPPQVLLQVLRGEAGGQARRYGPSDPTEQAVGVTIRQRFGDLQWFSGFTTWQNSIVSSQFNGIDTSVTSGQDPPGSGTQSPELINAAPVFAGTSAQNVANAKCFFSPTAGTDPNHPGWQQIQAALASGISSLPTVDADPKCYRTFLTGSANEQFIYKQSISPNTNGSGAPSFIFVQWRRLTDPAVIQIP